MTNARRSSSALALVAAVVAILALGACSSASKTASTTTTTASPSAAGTTATATIVLTSTAFANNSPIPKQYTCDGANRIPPLTWNAGTTAKSVALVVDDPDAPVAGGFLHWAVVGLPAVGELPPVPTGARQLPNGAGQPQWTGPCPPAGQPHHYHFTLYALSRDVQSRAEIAGATIGQTELVGTYKR